LVHADFSLLTFCVQQQAPRGGKLTSTQHKGRNRKPHRLTLPILPVLQRTIDATLAAT
jgi:hypothetical protein